MFSTNIFAVLVQVPGDCSCTRISVSSEGEAAATQSDKMGLYYLYGYHDGKVTNIHICQIKLSTNLREVLQCLLTLTALVTRWCTSTRADWSTSSTPTARPGPSVPRWAG